MIQTREAQAAAPAPAGEASAKGATSTPPLSVSQLAAQIGGVVDHGFPAAVRVVGEISNFSNRTHWYFAIKDAGSVLSCVMFANRTRGVGFVPEQGQQVLLTTRVEVYEPAGKLTLNVERIEPIGAGALELQLKRLVEELRALGWLSEDRKRALPIMPRTVAVITSRKGAALQDVLDTMKKRCPAVGVALIDVLVQGAAAAPDVERAIDWVSANADRFGIDALLVTRGGGSIEDLWAFNEKRVARAIVECSIPVVAAIGHETDTTVAELVADLRCATPTQAAMRLTPDAAALNQQLNQTGKRLRLAVTRNVADHRDALRALSAQLLSTTRDRLSRARRTIDGLALRLERAKPTSISAQRRARLEQLQSRLGSAVAARLRDAGHATASLTAGLHTAMRHRLVRSTDALSALDRQLRLVGPEQVLGRGYSITLLPGGKVVRRPSDASPGQAITTRLAEGELTSVVGSSLLVPLPRPRRKKPAVDDGSPGLFSE